MDCKRINTAILSAQDLPSSFIKNSEFYNYLFGNNVAYYYSSILSKKKTNIDKEIITAGNVLNDKYVKTLKLIDKICKENGIRFLLFKTYKYIPEVVDNDIDLLIKKKDFYQFMKILGRYDFDCLENEPLKGICRRKDFCTIEPRTNSSFHELIIMDENQLWNKTEKVEIMGIKIDKPIKEVEVAHLLLSLLYNPNYLRLYLLDVYKNGDFRQFKSLNLKKDIRDDLNLVIENLLAEKNESKKFPLFIDNFRFIWWWFRRIFSNSKLSLRTKLKHLIYFFYLKYLYLLFGKLIFKHEWFLRKI